MLDLKTCKTVRALRFHLSLLRVEPLSMASFYSRTAHRCSWTTIQTKTNKEWRPGIPSGSSLKLATSPLYRNGYCILLPPQGVEMDSVQTVRVSGAWLLRVIATKQV